MMSNQTVDVCSDFFVATKKSQEHTKSRKSVSLDQTSLKWKSYMKQNSNVVVFLGEVLETFLPSMGAKMYTPKQHVGYVNVNYLDRRTKHKATKDEDILVYIGVLADHSPAALLWYA